jgi:hypothetical protein
MENLSNSQRKQPPETKLSSDRESQNRCAQFQNEAKRVEWLRGINDPITQKKRVEEIERLDAKIKELEDMTGLDKQSKGTKGYINRRKLEIEIEHQKEVIATLSDMKANKDEIAREVKILESAQRALDAQKAKEWFEDIRENPDQYKSRILDSERIFKERYTTRLKQVECWDDFISYNPGRFEGSQCWDHAQRNLPGNAYDYIKVTSWSKLDDNEDADDLYRSYFNLKEKVLVIFAALREVDEEHDIPRTKPLQHSELLFHQHRWLLENVSHHASTEINEIIHLFVTNDDTEKAVLPYTKPGKEAFAIKGSDDYYLTLKSPNGRSAFFLVEQHPETYGDIEPDNIKVARTVKDPNGDDDDDDTDNLYKLAVLRIPFTKKTSQA